MADKGICRQSMTVLICRCMLVSAFDFDLVVGTKNIQNHTLFCKDIFVSGLERVYRLVLTYLK